MSSDRRPDTAGALAARSAPVTFPILPKDSGGGGGSATLTAAGDSLTEVAVVLRPRPNARPGEHRHTVLIHLGRCDAPADIAAVLNPVVDNGRSPGHSRTTVSLDLSTLLDGNHIIAVQTRVGPPGTIVACGEPPTR
jgi:hypothetical protein